MLRGMNMTWGCAFEINAVRNRESGFAELRDVASLSRGYVQGICVVQPSCHALLVKGAACCLINKLYREYLTLR